MSRIPEELLYDAEQHLWVRIDDETAYIGITDYAQDKMGELLFVELPEEDENFERGDVFSCVESSKKDNDLEAPFNFTIIEHNADLANEPEAVNEDAFDNWIVKVRIEDGEGIGDLVDSDVYRESIGE